ncbi:hypothetical protein MBOT_39350 [Mycobacterium botniense]|uniref:Uncharacterized protein n=1 Tax=Mycobacterium botniense TaxID=84962 RepID=A0A7I9Y3E2_9MYCO|nr:hypothetical protein MBOT_39350 [Mycobacterium botniense]
MAALHEHIGRHQDPTVAGEDQSRVVAGADHHLAGLASALYQSVDHAELTELSQCRPRFADAHFTSVRPADGRRNPGTAGWVGFVLRMRPAGVKCMREVMPGFGEEAG